MVISTDFYYTMIDNLNASLQLFFSSQSIQIHLEIVMLISKPWKNMEFEDRITKPESRIRQRRKNAFMFDNVDSFAA
jgi:hypothetical protein